MNSYQVMRLVAPLNASIILFPTTDLSCCKAEILMLRLMGKSGLSNSVSLDFIVHDLEPTVQ